MSLPFAIHRKMNNNSFKIAAIILFVAAAAALTALLLPTSTPPDKAATEEEVTSAKTPPKSPGNFDFGSASPVASGSASSVASESAGGSVKSGTGASALSSGSAPVASGKEATMAVIHDAMTTWSAEGVPTLQPLLSSPDKEIRAEAIEAMKQLSVPEAVAALRAQAKETKDPAERKALLDAAEWAALPSLFSPGGN